MDAFCIAVSSESSPPVDRFNAGIAWAKYAHSTHSSALDAYQQTINLLPHLATLGMHLQARQEALSSSNGLACNAASCAIEAGKLEKAVEFLEEGRGVFWAQSLQLRTPLDQLWGVAPELAKRLQGISNVLEKGSLRDVSRSMQDAPQKVMSIEKEASHFRRLGEDWRHTLDEVRKLEGFHDFLRPKSFDALQQAASQGPVVLLNASEYRCDGLIITQGGILHVPFPDLSLSTIKKWYITLQSVLSPAGIRDDQRHVKRVPEVKVDPEVLFQHVLEKLWLTVVHPVVCALNLKVGCSELISLYYTYILVSAPEIRFAPTSLVVSYRSICFPSDPRSWYL